MHSGVKSSTTQCSKVHHLESYVSGLGRERGRDLTASSHKVAPCAPLCTLSATIHTAAHCTLLHTAAHNSFCIYYPSAQQLAVLCNYGHFASTYNISTIFHPQMIFLPFFSALPFVVQITRTCIDWTSPSFPPCSAITRARGFVPFTL